MFRIDTATAALLKPAYPAEGTEKYFQDTDGAGGTIVPAWFLNQVQEEITNVIEDAGITPDKSDDSQLSAAVTAIASAAVSNVSSASRVKDTNYTASSFGFVLVAFSVTSAYLVDRFVTVLSDSNATPTTVVAKVGNLMNRADSANNVFYYTMTVPIVGGLNYRIETTGTVGGLSITWIGY
jgi:hypothetical protein